MSDRLCSTELSLLPGTVLFLPAGEAHNTLRSPHGPAVRGVSQHEHLGLSGCLQPACHLHRVCQELVRELQGDLAGTRGEADGSEALGRVR